MARSESAQVRVHGLQPVQVLAGLVGLVYLVGGAVGFGRTGFADFAGHQHVMLLGFMINPLHNLVHVVVGVLGVLTASGSGLSRAYGWILFVGYGLISIWGLMLTGVISSNPVSNLGNPLNINAADNWLHIFTALLGLVIAIMPARKAVHVPATQTAPAGTTDTTATTTEERPGRSFLHRRRHVAH